MRLPQHQSPHQAKVCHTKASLSELTPGLPPPLPSAKQAFQALDSSPRTQALSLLPNPNFHSLPEIGRGTTEAKDPDGFLLFMFPLPSWWFSQLQVKSGSLLCSLHCSAWLWFVLCCCQIWLTKRTQLKEILSWEVEWLYPNSWHALASPCSLFKLVCPLPRGET